MKYPDFYRLFDLENGFDKVNPLPVHKYSNNVDRLPKLNGVTFEITSSIEEVVDILKTLDYIETTDELIFPVIWKEQKLLCFIIKETVGIKDVYSIYAVNDAPSLNVSLSQYTKLIFVSEDVLNDEGETVIEKGWQSLKYSNKCYFILNNKAHPSIDCEFCFFNDYGDKPYDYSYESLNKIIGTDVGLIIDEDGIYTNYAAGLIISPFKDDSTTKYIDEETSKIIINDSNKAALKLKLVPATDDDDLLGKNVEDLQSDVLITIDTIYGISKYINDYTGFSSDPDLQKGNFIALKAIANKSATITTQIVGGQFGPVTLDSDGVCIFRLKDTATAIRYTLVSGDETVVYEYSLAGVEKETSNILSFTIPTIGESEVVGSIADFPKTNLKAILTRNNEEQTIYLTYKHSTENLDFWFYGGTDELNSEFTLMGATNIVSCTSNGSYTENCDVTIDLEDYEIEETLDALTFYETYQEGELASDIIDKIYFNTELEDLSGIIESTIMSDTNASIDLFVGIIKYSVPGYVDEGYANGHIILRKNNNDVSIAIYVEGEEAETTTIFDGEWHLSKDENGKYIDFKRWIEELGIQFEGGVASTFVKTNNMQVLLNGVLAGKPKNV